MSQPRNRWIINVVLVLAVIGFVGFSMIPLLGALNDNKPSSTAGSPAAPGQSPAADGQTSKLQDQARGYESVLQREPANETALEGLLQTRLQLLRLGQGDIKGVIEPLEKLAKLKPERTEFTILLAQAKQQVNDNEGAAQAYRSVLETKPGEILALQGLAALLLQQKRPSAAVGLLQDTLSNAGKVNQITPNSVDVTAVRLLLGQVYATEKRYGEAIAVYDQAIKGDSQDFRPVLAKAIVLNQQGKPELAKPLFENAAALAPAQYKDEINRLAAGEAANLTPPPNSTVEDKQ